MACQWLWSPDHINTAADIQRELGDANDVGGVAVTTANNRYGARNLRFSGGIGINGFAIKYLPGQYTEFYFGSAARWEEASSRPNFQFNENTTIHFYVRRNGTTGLLELVTDAGVVATGTTVIPLSEWHFLEVYGLIDDTNGRVIVKLDQRFSSTDYEIDYTGDTKGASTTGFVNRIRFDGNNGNSQLKITDLYFNDTTGDFNNSWMGDMAVFTLRPNGVGDQTDFTPTPTVANYLNVDDTVSDGDSTYNESPNAVGTKDLYEMEDSSVEVQAVFAVQVSVIARKQPAGPRGHRTLLKVGTTESEGTDEILIDNYTTKETVYDFNPDTGNGWNKAGLDSIQAGVKVQY